MTAETYATLLNLRLVVHSSKSNYVAVDRNFWTHSFGSQIDGIEIDEAWYRERYDDVASAIKNGTVLDARQHFRESGYFEHRMPFAIGVNETWYLQQYADVGDAIAKAVYASAQEHFEQVGYREGRLPFPGFSLTKGRKQTG